LGWHKILLSANTRSGAVIADDLASDSTPGTFLKQTNTGLQWASTAISGEVALSRTAVFSSNATEINVQVAAQRSSLGSWNTGIESTSVTNNSSQITLSAGESSIVVGAYIESVNPSGDILANGAYVVSKIQEGGDIIITLNVPPKSSPAGTVTFKCFNMHRSLETDALFEKHTNGTQEDHDLINGKPVIITGFTDGNSDEDVSSYNSATARILDKVDDDYFVVRSVAADIDEVTDQSNNVQFIEAATNTNGGKAVSSILAKGGSEFLTQLSYLNFRAGAADNTLAGIGVNLVQDTLPSGGAINTGGSKIELKLPQDIGTNSSVDFGSLRVAKNSKIQLDKANSETAFIQSPTGVDNDLIISAPKADATIDLIATNVAVSNDLTVAGDLTVTGTTKTIDTVTMEASNAVIFEGVTADAHETTLTIVDPTADQTIKLPNQSGCIPLLAVNSTTQISSTPEELNLLDGVDGLDQADFTKLAAVDSTAAELNLLNNVTGLVQADFTKLAAIESTADELNIMDGDTSATATTIVDADRVVLNDNGTMKQVAVTDLTDYFDHEITNMPNLVETGDLNDGSITSGFGAINIGSSALTATGTNSLGVTTFSGNITISDTYNINLQESITFTGATTENKIVFPEELDSALSFQDAGDTEFIKFNTIDSGTYDNSGIVLKKPLMSDDNTTTGNYNILSRGIPVYAPKNGETSLYFTEGRSWLDTAGGEPLYSGTDTLSSNYPANLTIMCAGSPARHAAGVHMAFIESDHARVQEHNPRLQIRGYHPEWTEGSVGNDGGSYYLFLDGCSYISTDGNDDPTGNNWEDSFFYIGNSKALGSSGSSQAGTFDSQTNFLQSMRTSSVVHWLHLKGSKNPTKTGYSSRTSADANFGESGFGTNGVYNESNDEYSDLFYNDLNFVSNEYVSFTKTGGSWAAPNFEVLGLSKFADLHVTSGDIQIYSEDVAGNHQETDFTRRGIKFWNAVSTGTQKQTVVLAGPMRYIDDDHTQNANDDYTISLPAVNPTTGQMLAVRSGGSSGIGGPEAFRLEWTDAGSGSVTSVTAGNGLTQSGTSTINPTLDVVGGTGLTAAANAINLDNTAVTPAQYTNATITVDQQGRITAASSGSGGWTGTATSDLNMATYSIKAHHATSETTTVLSFDGTGGTENYLEVSSSDTAPFIAAKGSDTNVSVGFKPQGTGSLALLADTGGTGAIDLFKTDNPSQGYIRLQPSTLNSQFNALILPAVGSSNSPKTLATTDDIHAPYSHPDHSGDVTSTGDGATVIGANKVTLSMMATMATDSFIGRTTVSTGDPEVLSAGDARTILGVADGADVTPAWVPANDPSYAPGNHDHDSDYEPKNNALVMSMIFG